LPSIYSVRLFRREGFERKKCSECGRIFWTLDPTRTTCGDTPCVEYGFIGDPPTRRRLTLPEMEKRFLRFFERRGHKVIKRYPVVARWRNDIFLTIASIANFQPWVTEGLVPPPANPLVVSQPSIRLKDIDNVGRSGKHFTLFFMGGHHAFNSKREKIYWNHETIELCHEFLTRGLGINEEEISYVQDLWEGGGNAGEDFEVNVRGLEIATLVFMRYKLSNGARLPLPLTIVDTGYGMERLTWLSLGTPSCYEAIFPEEVAHMRKLAGVGRPPADVVAENSKLAGMLDVASGRDLKMMRGRVAARTGMSVEELERILSPLEASYAIADHLRCLAFMFGDGITPSNVREGYLARSVLRRTLWLMRVLKLTVPLSELMDFELRKLSRSFPEFEERSEYILNVVENEERKYRESMVRGTRMVERIAREAQRSGTGIPREKLVELYDSHGLTPDIVKEVAGGLGVAVSIPEDFYAMVTKSQEKPKHVAGKKVQVPENAVKRIRPTKLLYYDFPTVSEFRARVIRTFDDYVVLDQTAFYPEGGGQPSDIGFIESGKNRVKVVSVAKVGDVVLHRVDGNPFKRGQRVRGTVDWGRRRSLMVHHTATHVILGAARKVLGSHIWQQGVQKEVESARLDISHFRRISGEELGEIERLANAVVMENRPVRATWMDRNAAEEKYGFDLYQGGVVPGRKVRVVDIEGWNTQACAGTHCQSTGEIGFIKILRTERIQDGIERIEFAAGLSAVKHVLGMERELRKVAEIVRTPPERAAVGVEDLFKRWKELQKEVKRLRERISSSLAEALLHGAVKIGDFRAICQEMEGANVDELIKISSMLTRMNDDLVVTLFSRGVERVNIVAMAGSGSVRAGINCGSLVSELCNNFGGGGGGRENMGQGSIPNPNMTPDTVKKAFELIKKVLER